MTMNRLLRYFAGITSCVVTFMTAPWVRGETVTYTTDEDYIIHGGAFFPPQAFQVSGFSDPVAAIRVTFNGLTHETPGDIDALLVGPAGHNVMLMSDTGEAAFSPEVIDLQLSFRDGAPLLPETEKLLSGTYAPTNYVGFGEIPEMDQMTSNPPPLPPYGTIFSSFNGSSPNGSWTLYIQDDRDDDGGFLSGWSLTITTVPEPNVTALLLFGATAIGMGRVSRRRAATRHVNLKNIVMFLSVSISFMTTAAYGDHLPPVTPVLPGQDHRHENHSGADFSGDDLSDVNFSEGNLTETRFEDARLERVLFIGATLDRAILHTHLAGGANFSGASLVNAELRGMEGMGVIFSDADLSGVEMDDAFFVFSDFRNVNFTGADLGEFTAEDSDFRGADLSLSTNIDTLFFRSVYDSSTRFPPGYDPQGAGMVFVPEPMTGTLLLLGVAFAGAQRNGIGPRRQLGAVGCRSSEVIQRAAPEHDHHRMTPHGESSHSQGDDVDTQDALAELVARACAKLDGQRLSL